MSAMVFAGRNIEMREKMPQTVPSAGFSPPCDYSAFAADCFDLSLLPGSTDSEVPLSPVSIQHLLAMYSDPTTPPPMFHTNQEKDFENFENFKTMEEDNANSNKQFSFDNFGTMKSSINTEKTAQNQQNIEISNETDAFENFGNLKIPMFSQEQQESNSAPVTNVFENFGDLTKSTMSQDNSLKNPAMTSMNVFEEFRTLKSPPMCQDKSNDSMSGNPYQYHRTSPVPSSMLNVVKEEPSYLLTPCMGSYPSPYAPSVSPTPSPSSSYASNLSPYPMSPSSQMGIKQEQTLDLQEILEESHFLQESMHSTKQRSTSSTKTTLDLSQTVANFCNILMSNPEMNRKKSMETTPVSVNVQSNEEMGSSSSFSSGLSSTAHKDDDLMKKSMALGNLLLGFGASGSLPKQESPTSSCKRGVGDHALLREVLKDTSFQRKYNLKPFAFEALGGLMTETRPEQLDVKTEVKMEVDDSEDAEKDEGATGGARNDSLAELSREKIEPVLSMAIEQLRKDVDSTCNMLGIAPDPVQWTIDDVKAWLLWTLRQYSLPDISMEYFNMDGVGLTSLSEEDFQQRAPQCGSTLHAQLEIWKAACQDIDAAGLLPWSTTANSTCSGSSGDISEDDEVESVPSPTVGKPVTARTGGSHIHLWQFLKELLASPQVHGSCIRWLDRTKGVFKIEDSVRVARLWGKRKNRPAMNYDKLSRSIRQYYKKGIMKKTERSQRLVYQFCHPYCL